MQEENELTPPQRELAAALAGLRPKAAGIDRNRLMFRAGQASMRKRQYAWQGLAAGLAVCLASLLWLRQAQNVAVAPTPQGARMTLQLPAVHNESEPREAATGEYLHLRDAVLAKGLDALPTPAFAGPAEPSQTLRSMLDAMSQHSNHKPASGEHPARPSQGDNL
jgi:hypothetical protein